MNKDEALKMAIIALQKYPDMDLDFIEAAKACKEALEQTACKHGVDDGCCKECYMEQTQPAQEPVALNEEEFNAIAYAYRSCPAHEVKMVSERYQDLVDYVLSIAHPAPSWQGLSDDEIFELHHNWIMNSGNKDTQYDFARAIEQALKERNGR